MSAAAVLYTITHFLARLSNLSQIVLFLPLTLSTLGQPSFLLLSLALTLLSLLSALLLQLLPALSPAISFLQLPIHPFLLLLTFNLSTPSPSSSSLPPTLALISHSWGTTLRALSPLFVTLEGLASLLLVQSYSHRLISLATDRDTLQFALLVLAASTYVASATWLVLCFPAAASSPVSATLLGAAVTCLLFLTAIGFFMRRTNVLESAGVALYLAYNVWLCGRGESPGGGWGWKEGTLSLSLSWSASYPALGLFPDLLPHLNTLLTLLTHTIPKTLVFSLVYRLSVLHRASKVLLAITAGPWDDDNDDDEEGVRPSRRLAYGLVTYRQTILVIVYSHLLLLDHSTQVWWRWINIFFTLVLWALELRLTDEEEDVGMGKEWKVE